MSSTVREGELLWTPSEEFKKGSELQRYMEWLKKEKGLSFPDYDSLWRWSVTEIETFWATIVEFFDVELAGEYSRVLSTMDMPGARWFEGASANYVEQLRAHVSREGPSIIAYSEMTGRRELSWKGLWERVGSVANSLRSSGVKSGDRVVAYVPNIPEAVVAFLATASLGAVWSSTSPDFGSQSVIDRFRQIGPKVLFAVDGYRYGGKSFDRRETVEEIMGSIPSLSTVVLIPYLNPDVTMAGTVVWDQFLSRETELNIGKVPFNHPLWILFSSGTTGLPKAIVQSHGGILLEHLKALAFHLDLKPGDRFMWWTTTGWMMWNFLVGGLLVGSTIVLYDGSPAYPETDRLFDIARESELKVLGAGAAYFNGCMKGGVHPGNRGGFPRLRAVGSTGSPLSTEAFKWLYDEVKKDLWVVSLSGGTDLCTAFIGGSPLLPVRAGELQCRSLGAPVASWGEDGREVVGEVGELVLRAPMPSMPIYFWNDPKGEKYRNSYFDLFPGVWRHGDWIRMTPEGGAVILGRSDATLKKKGVRMGTAEIYSVVESMPEIVDSLVVGIDLPDGGYFMPLIVVLRDGGELTPELKKNIHDHIRDGLSSRHLPDVILSVPALPRTLNGKKLEVPIRKILMGIPPEKAVNPGSVTAPDLIYEIAELVRKRLPSAKNS